MKEEKEQIKRGKIELFFALNTKISLDAGRAPKGALFGKLIKEHSFAFAF